MAIVREIMTSDPATVDVAMSLREALEVLVAAGVSGAPVLRGAAVVGVVSTSDILELAATTPGVPTGRAGESDWGELEITPEWEEGRDSPSGFFTDFWSDAGADVRSRLDAPESPEWDLLGERDVSEAMSRKIVWVTPDAGIVEAARTMIDASVHRALVIDDGQLDGIVSAIDIVRAVAEGRT